MTSTDNPDWDAKQEVPDPSLDAPAEPDDVAAFNERNQGRDSDRDPSQEGVSQDPLDWQVDTTTEAPANGREG